MFPRLLLNVSLPALCANFIKVFKIIIYSYVYANARCEKFYFSQTRRIFRACFSQYLCEKLDNQCQVDMIFTDFTKAFDHIDQNDNNFKVAVF